LGPSPEGVACTYIRQICNWMSLAAIVAGSGLLDGTRGQEMALSR
jgi:hypothetical protein